MLLNKLHLAKPQCPANTHSASFAMMQFHIHWGPLGTMVGFQGALREFMLRKDLRKLKAMSSSSAWCSERESWMKGMPWGEGEGWAHKIQPLQKALFVSFTAAGMCPMWDEGQHGEAPLPQTSSFPLTWRNFHRQGIWQWKWRGGSSVICCPKHNCGRTPDSAACAFTGVTGQTFP